MPLFRQMQNRREKWRSRQDRLADAPTPRRPDAGPLYPDFHVKLRGEEDYGFPPCPVGAAAVNGDWFIFCTHSGGDGTIRGRYRVGDVCISPPNLTSSRVTRGPMIADIERLTAFPWMLGSSPSKSMTYTNLHSLPTCIDRNSYLVIAGPDPAIQGTRLSTCRPGCPAQGRA